MAAEKALCLRFVRYKIERICLGFKASSWKTVAVRSCLMIERPYKFVFVQSTHMKSLQAKRKKERRVREKKRKKGSAHQCR